MSGTDKRDVLYGRAGKDALFGFAGDDDLYGEDGDDVLAGGAGTNAIDGGDGFDTVDYSDAAGPVFVSLFESYGRSSDRGDTLVSVERAVGSAFGDVMGVADPTR